MLDKVFLGQRVSKLDIGETSQKITRVNLLVDSDHMYTAGDDTGRTIEKTCPWGTQAMCNSILARVSGVEYKPFSGESGLIDPAAETGDGITVGGVYSVLADSIIRFNGLYSADISAPGGSEVEDEYPYKSRAQRQAERQSAQIYSRITKTAEQITLEVNNQVAGLNSKIELTASSLTSQINNVNSGLSSKIEQTASSLTSQISSTNGQVSSIKQYVDGITLSVSNGSTSSSIVLKSGSTTISSQTIQMNGLVTFTGLSSGTTTINGACIKTGTIDANRLNLTGAITFSDLNYQFQQELNSTANAAQTASSTASSAYGLASGWTYSGTTYIDGAKIMTGTVMASKLLGGYVGLLDANQSNVGWITITSTSTGYGIEISSNTGGIRINPSGNFWVDTYNGSFGITSSGVVCGRHCVPLVSNQYSLGASGLYWSDIYATNDTIHTSDREKKKDIDYDMERYDALFGMLRPVSYRFKDGQSGRTHLGLISQDVEDALAACGMTGMDFAGFIKSPVKKEDGDEMELKWEYGLRYGEFISMCIYQIQKLISRVEKLEGK